MRELLLLFATARLHFRGSLPARLATVIAMASLAGATAGFLPAFVGLALDAILGREGPVRPGLAGLLGAPLAEAGPAVVLPVAFAATLATVGLSVLSSRLGSSLAGEVTAAVRVAMLRSALFASARDVEALGRSMAESKGGPAPPPGAKVPVTRGAEVIKLAIARESALASDFAVAVATGLPQAVVTLAVLAYELILGGTWIVLGGGATLFVISRIASDRAARRVARETAAMQRADVAVFSEIGEKLASTEDLRLLGARGEAVLEFASAARRAADARARFASALAASGQIKSVFSAMAPLLILVALQASSAPRDAGDVAKLLLYVPLLMARLEGLDALRAGLIERGPVLAATAALFGLPVSPVRAPGAASATAAFAGAITFDAVSFTPPGAGRPVIDGLSLAIPAGAVVGICGPSGCGKSTLLRLLLRLDEPDAGRIAVGGVDVRALDPDALPRVFGVLGQSSRLLERSIGDNLALGLSPRPTDDAMRAALRGAHLDDLARAGGDGRGLATEFRAVPPSLSGGEQRRVLLARMLVRDASIFVLDEPESGLPSATAEALLREVARLAGGRTCVVVTHAPHLLASTFNVVLDGGKVAAMGAHDELAATSALYRSLLADGLKGAAKIA